MFCFEGFSSIANPINAYSTTRHGSGVCILTSDWIRWPAAFNRDVGQTSQTLCFACHRLCACHGHVVSLPHWLSYELPHASRQLISVDYSNIDNPANQYVGYLQGSTSTKEKEISGRNELTMPMGRRVGIVGYGHLGIALFSLNLSIGILDTILVYIYVNKAK